MKKRKIEKRFLEELQKVHIISIACERVGLSRQTIYRWMFENFKFKSAVEKAQEMGIDSICDLSESKLVSNINKGNQRSIEYFLNKHCRRYKQTKTLSTDEQFVPITAIHFHEYSGYEKLTANINQHGVSQNDT